MGLTSVRDGTILSIFGDEWKFGSISIGEALFNHACGSQAEGN
jgi:hypothetical protein